MDEALLRELVTAGKSVRAIARAVDRSPTTVRHWLRRHGLVTAASARRLARAKGELPPTERRRCRKHGEVEHRLDATGYYRCPRCAGDRVQRRRRVVRQLLIAEAGGRCRLCGYSQYVGALQFHHRDPTQKEFGLSGRGLTRAIDVLRAEARKCVLLCANCHAEVEGGFRALP